MLQHIGETPSVRLDIAKFFPNTSFGAIYRFFRFDLQCEPDIAWLLSSTTSYKGILPTGSAVSQPLALLVALPMLQEIASLPEAYDCVLTCYVDDIVLTGWGANVSLLTACSEVMNRWGFAVNWKKSRVLPASAPKRITGVIVTRNGLRVPNERQKRIGELLAERQCNGRGSELAGRLAEARQIEYRFERIK